MQTLLADPTMQSAVIPFLAALFSCGILWRVNYKWAGLCVLFGFFATAYLVNGMTFSPLTSTRKLIVLFGAAALLGVVLDFRPRGTRIRLLIALGAAVAATVWVLWPLLLRKPVFERALLLGACLLFVAALTLSLVGLGKRPLRAGVAAAALGAGVGGVALLGASALIAQLMFAVAASSGALLLTAMAVVLRPGAAMTLPIGLASGLAGVGAVVFASTPWFALLPLLSIPALVRVPLPEGASHWRRIASLFIVVAPAPAIAWASVWWVRGGPVF